MKTSKLTYSLVIAVILISLFFVLKISGQPACYQNSRNYFQNKSLEMLSNNNFLRSNYNPIFGCYIEIEVNGYSIVTQSRFVEDRIYNVYRNKNIISITRQNENIDLGEYLKNKTLKYNLFSLLLLEL